MANKISESNNMLLFAIDCGSTFIFTAVLKDGAGDPVDVTGYTAELACKSGPGGAEHFRISSDDDITVGTTDGKFTVKLTPTNTRLLQGAGVGLKGSIQMEVTDTSGNVTRLVDGKFVGSPEVVD